MYKIFVVFNYETIIKGYYEDLEKAQAAYQLWKGKYERQGYTGKYWDPSLGLESDPNAWVKVDGDEIRTNEEWVYTVSRIPFVGRTGDPGTGEMSYTPTGMTDTIEIHLELRSKASINPMGIKMNDNWTKARAMSVMTPPKNGDSFPGDFITVFYGSGGRFNYKLAGVSAGEYIYESIIACDAPQFLYRVESNSLDNFVVYDKPDHNSYQAVIYRPIIPAGEISSFKPTPTPTYCTVSASTAHGTVTGSGRYAKGDTCVLTWSPGGEPYEFVRWSNGVTTNPYSFVVTTDISLTAEVEYAPERYTLTFNATNGSCSPSTFTGTTGDTVTVTVTPTAGNIFKQWNDGNMQNPRIFTVGTQSEIYTATCDVAVMRTITMTSIANCSVTVNDAPYTGPVQVAESTRCTINCIPAEGYKFTKWQGDVIGNYTPFTFTVAAKNYTISPVVDHITYTLSFELNAFLTFTGAGTYNAGTSVQIEAIPNAHARFEKWWDDSDENPRTIVVNSNMRLSAVGHAIDYNLVVIAAPLNGLLSGTVTGGGSYVYDTMAPLTFTPIDGKTNFASWSDGGAINHSHRVTADETVTAYATGIVQEHHETATHGSVTIHPSSSWVYGDNAIVEFVPEQHYHFSAWQDGNTDNPRTIQVQGPVQLHCDGTLDGFRLEGTCPHFKINAYVDGVKISQLPYTFDYGTVVTLKAEECDDAFVRFQGWSDGETDPVHSPITVEQAGTYDATSYELAPNCLRLKSTSTNTICIVYETTGSFERLVNCFYSMDGINWTRMPEGSDNAVTFSDIKIRGNNLQGMFPGWYSKTDRAYGKKAYLNVQGDGLCDLSGNISSLLNEAGGAATVPNYSNFKGLFRGAKIASVTSEFFNVMADSCYNGVFEGSKIESIPVLPSELESSCFGGLFKNCTSITSIPEDALPATTLASSCYAVMFQGCTGLTSLPEGLLPATTLASSCYGEMFEYCTGLTSIPGTLLPAETLADHCYNHMFSGCRGLTSIPNNLLPATTLAESCYYHMFSDCRITSVPQGLLHVRTLVKGCYDRMFHSCYPLCEVHCAATDVSASDCTFAWLTWVSATGDFYGPATMNPETGTEGQRWSRGANGVPVGWTYHNEE